MAGFYRGTTPTFRLSPVGYSVTELGTPNMILSQGQTTVSLVVEIDAENNRIQGTLDYDDSLMFVPDRKAMLQAVWDAGDNGVVAFPSHELDVFQTYIEFEYEVEPEPTTVINEQGQEEDQVTEG